MDQIGLVFPGQGSQAAGMGLEVYEGLAEARSLLKRANDILGFNIDHLMFGNSDEALKPTEIAQPAIFICSAMYLEKFKLLIDSPFVAVAGHSLGEYTALYASGMISFECGLKLTRKRGLVMSKSTQTKCGMAAIIGLPVDQISNIVSQFTDLYIANENSRIQTVISGESDQLKKACGIFEKAGAKVVQLAVSTAFHTPFMEQAKKKMQLEIEKIVFKKPNCYVIPNIIAKPTEDVEEIKKALVEQITGKVRWLESFKSLRKLGINKVYEIGYGNVLKKLGMTITRKIKVLSLCGIR